MNLNQRKLTPDEVSQIRIWWRARAIARKIPCYRVMAKRMGVSPGTLYQIGKFHRYKETS